MTLLGSTFKPSHVWNHLIMNCLIKCFQCFYSILVIDQPFCICITNRSIIIQVISVEAFLNSFPTSGNFCHLLITFANSLDPDKARQNIGPDLDSNCLTFWWYSWKNFWKNLLKKKSTDDKKACRLRSMQRVNYPLNIITIMRNVNKDVSLQVEERGRPWSTGWC